LPILFKIVGGPQNILSLLSRRDSLKEEGKKDNKNNIVQRGNARKGA